MILGFLPIAQFRLVRAPLANVGVWLPPTLASGVDMKRSGALRAAILTAPAPLYDARLTTFTTRPEAF